MMEMRAHNQATWIHGCVEIFMFDPERKEYVQRLELKKDMDEGSELPAVARLKAQQAQMLMDDLWNCGLRPTEGSGSAGALAAVQQHLADMRKIALFKLGIRQ